MKYYYEKYQHYIDAWVEVIPTPHRKKKRQLLQPLNNLGKRIIQKKREPTIYENS